MTGPQIPIMYWPGSGSATVNTPFSIFENDDIFSEDAPKVAKWVCNSLGYPVLDVELTDQIIYSQFEQATLEFSSQVQEFLIRENMLSLQGASLVNSLTGVLIKGTSIPYIIELASNYGMEANVGGYVDFKKGYIELQTRVQDYDLQSLWAAVSESGNRIEIRRIYHERTPAINRFFDPFAGGAGQGVGLSNLLGEFGWGNYSVASQYLLMPMYETALRVQAIELNDTMRRSQYSFELKNNKLKVIPVPTEDDNTTKLWFEYVVTQDKFFNQIGAPGTSAGASGSYAGGVVSDYSNVPYEFILYENINDVGRRWIWKYTLALCKIILGSIRSKYESLPIPNSEIRMDGLALRQEGQKDTESLLLMLRETLEQTGRHAQMMKTVENEEAVTEVLKRIPPLIYVA